MWLCAQAGFEPRIRFTTDDYVAAQALVAAGLGMTVLPMLALGRSPPSGVRTEGLPGASREVLLARYGRPPDPPAVLAVAAALDAAAKSGSWAAPTRPASPPSVAGRTPQVGELVQARVLGDGGITRGRPVRR